jgi:hypothetical protein
MQAVNETCTSDAPGAASKAPATGTAPSSAPVDAAAASVWRSKLSAANPAKLPEEDVAGFYMKRRAGYP